MHRGFYAGLILLTGVPGRTKCPVASAYATEISTDILILDVLNTVWDWRLIFKIDCFRVCTLVGKLIFLGLLFIFSSSLSMEESSDISDVGAILLSYD